MKEDSLPSDTVLTTKLSHGELKKIYESDFGRRTGWIVELNGLPIAILHSGVRVEMFWDQYEVSMLTDDEQIQLKFWSSDFWNMEAISTGITFRNRELTSLRPAYFPIIHISSTLGVITARGLYFSVEEVKAPSEEHIGLLSRWRILFESRKKRE